MTEGLILENLGGAKYRVNIDKTPDSLIKRIENLEKQIFTLNNDIYNLENILNEIINDRNFLLSELEALAMEGYKENREAIRTKQIEIQEKEILYNTKYSELNRARAEKIVLENSRLNLIGVKDEEKTIYCADYSDSLENSNVGLHPISGKDSNILIAPSGSATKGNLIPAVNMTNVEAIYSYCVDPAQRKWKPTTRTGVITEIDFNTNKCSVRLDEVEVDGETLNLKTDLTGVSISYMECDALAFSEGDNVLIEFENQNWDNPKLIGFATGPKPCPLFFLIGMTDFQIQSEIIDLANERISALQKYLSFFAEGFQLYDDLKSYYSTLEGKCARIFPLWITFYCAEEYTKEYVDYLIEEADKGISILVQHKQQIEETIKKWEDIKKIEIKNMFLGQEVFNKQGQSVDKWYNTRFLRAASSTQYIFKAENIINIPLKILPGDGSGVRTRELFASDFAEYFYNNQSGLNEYYRMQIVNQTKILNVVYDIFSFRMNARPFYSPERKLFYIASSDWYFEGFGEPLAGLETAEIKVNMGGQTIFSYPQNGKYLLTELPIGETPRFEFSMDISFSGMLMELPDYFGEYEIRPYRGTYNPEPGNGMLIGFDPGGLYMDLERDQFSFLDMMFNSSRHLNERYGRAIYKGFEYFAGQYPDHPITTGQNIYNVSETTSLSDLQEVNTFVNSTFIQKAEDTYSDRWKFLTADMPEGDCEDFVLTKIDMLLQKGWSIDRLKIATGVKLDVGTGHAWLVVDNKFALDSLREQVVNRDILDEEWNHNRTIQESGLFWRTLQNNSEGEEVYEAVPWPHKKVDTKLCTIKASIDRMTATDKSRFPIV